MRFFSQMPIKSEFICINVKHSKIILQIVIILAIGNSSGTPLVKKGDVCEGAARSGRGGRPPAIPFQW
jgi:hypothetical protein